MPLPNRRHRKNSDRTRGRISGRTSHSGGRRAAFEPLEDRRLLAVSPEWLTTLDEAEGYWTTDPNIPHIAGHADGGFSAVGVFQGTVDFDPGPGELILSSFVEFSPDTVIARYTDAGDVLWARQIAGADYRYGLIRARGVATDSLGNTYVLSEFENSVQIGEQTFTGDESDGYVAKLDANGNFVWAQPLRASNSSIDGIAVDDSDVNPANWSVFVSGQFKGTATLGEQTYSSGKGKNVTVDTFVSKLSAGAGDFQWTQIIGGQGTQVPRILASATTGDAGLYISGDFDTEAKIGNVTLTGPAGSHFLAKLNPATGATLWARTVAVAAPFGSLAATADGVVMAGNFTGTVDFDPGTGVFNLTSTQGTNHNVGVLKLDSSGNFLWAQRMGGILYPSDNPAPGATGGMAVNADGHVFLTGYFGYAAADFGSQVFTSDRFDGFLVELDAAGEFVEAYQFGDRGYSTAVDGLGNVYVTGFFDSREHNAPFYEQFPTGDFLRSAPPMFMKFSPNAPPLDPTPSIHTFVAMTDPVIAGEDVTLTIDRYRDPNRQVKGFNFYLDNGDGLLNSADDLLVGTDLSPSFNEGWSATVSTAGLAAGAYTYFAEAIDELGTPLATAAVELNVEVSVPVVIETVSYASTSGPQAIPDATGNRKRPTVTTWVSNLTVPDSFTISDVNVTLNISHTYNSDLIAELVAPNGTRVTLFSKVGGASDNFTNTIFDDQASTSITSGSGPFSGSYRPESLLSALNGIDAAGVWKLEIRDTALQNSGTLHGWSLQLSYEATPALLQMAIEPMQSASTTELKASDSVLATQQAFAEPASDLWVAAAARARRPQFDADVASELPEEDATDDLYRALGLALEAEFSPSA
jgi:subtilisin-like proprotein convertase family protein